MYSQFVRHIHWFRRGRVAEHIEEIVSNTEDMTALCRLFELGHFKAWAIPIECGETHARSIFIRKSWKQTEKTWHSFRSVLNKKNMFRLVIDFDVTVNFEEGQRKLRKWSQKQATSLYTPKVVTHPQARDATNEWILSLWIVRPAHQNHYYSKLRAPPHRHSENIVSRKTPPRQSSNMKRTSTYYVQSQAKPNQYEHTRVSGAKNSQSHRVVLQPSPRNRALVIIFASRHLNSSFKHIRPSTRPMENPADPPVYRSGMVTRLPASQAPRNCASEVWLHLSPCS